MKYNNFWINTLTAKPGECIYAKLSGRDELIQYTTNILELLVTDPIVEYITDKNGAVIFSK